MEWCVNPQAINLPGAMAGVKSRFSMDFGGFQDLINFDSVMIIPIITL
jgi:hypothetical protein